MCLKAMHVVPQVRFVAWDVAITPDGPVFIEGNSSRVTPFRSSPPTFRMASASCRDSRRLSTYDLHALPQKLRRGARRNAARAFAAWARCPPKSRARRLHRWGALHQRHAQQRRGLLSGCGLRCVFCQNESISQRGEGKIVTPKRLSEIFRELEAQGAHNINLVTAAHFVPAVLEALALYRPNIPIVYNSSGYESVETLRMLEGAVDIYLPDYKYIDPNMAAMLSGAQDYPDTAHAAIEEMVRQTGVPIYDQDGMMTRAR